MMDRPLFFIKCAFKSGNVFVEVDRSRMTRSQVVDDIFHGQYENVVTVIECNPFEHICDDITADVRAEVEALREPSPPLAVQNLQDWKWDHARGMRVAF